MPSRPYTVHPIVTRLFSDAVKRLLPEVPAFDPPLPQGTTHEQANALLALAVQLTGRQDLGVLAAEAAESGHFDLVELASRTQSNVMEALETIGLLLPALHSGLELSLEQGPGQSSIELRFASGCELHPAGYDFIAATFLIAARRQTGQPVAPLRVALPYPPISEAPALAHIMSCAFSFNAPHLRIDFPSAYLELALTRADSSMGRALRELAPDVLERACLRKQSPLEQNVRRRVRAALSGETASASALARQLGMSERTLRRKLEMEGLSLRALTDDVRRRRAFELLDAESASTEAIAEQLGFTTAQAFHRAFRRWTGETIQAYRARVRKS